MKTIAIILFPPIQTIIFYLALSFVALIPFVSRHYFHAIGIFRDIEHIFSSFAIPAIMCLPVALCVHWGARGFTKTGWLGIVITAFQKFPIISVILLLILELMWEGVFKSQKVQWVQVSFDVLGAILFLFAHNISTTKNTEQDAPSNR